MIARQDRVSRWSPHDVALRADQLLRTLARDNVLVGRRLGQGLARMAEANHFAALGYSCMENYAQQRLGISGRSAQELAWMERHLPAHPAIEQAFERGALTFSHVRKLLQAKMSREDEGIWAERAIGMSIAQLEETLDQWKVSERPDENADGCQQEAEMEAGGYELYAPEEEERSHAIRCHVSPSVYLKFELAVEVARRMNGADLPVGTVLESMMAEYLSGPGAQILAALDSHEADDAEEVPGAVLPWRRRRADVAAMRRDLDISLAEITDHWRHLNWEVPSLPSSSLPSLPQANDGADAAVMDSHLHNISRYTRSREYHLMKLLTMVADDRLYDCLEFSSLQQYAAERLGISPRTAWTLVSLYRGMRRLPMVVQSFHDGLLNRAQADLVSQVATAQTQRVWIEHARTTTIKCFRQDVERACRLRDLDPESFMDEGILPPVHSDRLQVCAPVADENPVRACAPTAGDNRLRTCASGELLSEDEDEDGQPLRPSAFAGLGVRERLQMFRRGQMDDVATEGVLTIRFRLPHALVGMWRNVFRACQVVLGNMATVADCLEVCADAFLNTWAPEALHSIREHLVLERDGWVCANPTCTRRAELHEHHLQYRSQGGSDESWNLLSLCRFCHLRLVHDNRIRVKGVAPEDLTWELGVGQASPHLLVVCRRVVGGAACDATTLTEDRPLAS